MMIEFITQIPLFFKIVYALALLSLLGFTYSVFLINRSVERVKKLTAEKRIKYTAGVKKILKMYKFLFWISPLYLIIIPFITYKYAQDDFYHWTICMFLMYLQILFDYSIRKLFLSKYRTSITTPPTQTRRGALP